MPDTVEPTPLSLESASIEVGTKWHPTQDVSDRDGVISHLQIGSKVYEWGIGCVAPTTITVDLDGQSQRFRASVGVQYRRWIGERGPTIFAVRVDGVEVERVIRNGNDDAYEFDVDLTGAKSLALVTLPAGSEPHYERAVWGHASIARRSLSRGIVFSDFPVVYQGVPGRLITTFEADPE